MARRNSAPMPEPEVGALFRFVPESGLVGWGIYLGDRRAFLSGAGETATSLWSVTSGFDLWSEEGWARLKRGNDTIEIVVP